jgi:DNA repair protein RadA/Sms
MGRCTACSAWNTLVEEVVSRASGSAAARASGPSAARPIREIDADHAARVSSGIGELDRVLGGGAVLGGVTLLGGDPGVGKSTLLMQALAGFARSGARALYVSGEESAGQTAARARRLGADPEGLLVLAEGDLDLVERAIDEVKPVALVLDSVQTVRAPNLESASGTVSQLREVAARLVDRSKRTRMTTFLVGHVTKDGTLAGPKVLEHIVDTVLAFEGERGQSFRTLRAQKNRFGSATEVGVFEMTAEGMQEVKNPSALFLAERPKNTSGSVIAATSEGSRPMLVEVQALASPAAGAGRRTSRGIDAQRLAMILAVLERKAGLRLASADVFVNVAGGVHVDEPAVDLPVALAVASSMLDRAVPWDLVAFGELGLAGEVRSVARTPERLTEADTMGFRRVLAPPSAASGAKLPAGVTPVKTLSDALNAAGLVSNRSDG